MPVCLLPESFPTSVWYNLCCAGFLFALKCIVQSIYLRMGRFRLDPWALASNPHKLNCIRFLYKYKRKGQCLDVKSKDLTMIRLHTFSSLERFLPRRTRQRCRYCVMRRTGAAAEATWIGRPSSPNWTRSCSATATFKQRTAQRKRAAAAKGTNNTNGLVAHCDIDDR